MSRVHEWNVLNLRRRDWKGRHGRPDRL